MCYFLCISTTQNLPSIDEMFPVNFILEDAITTPIGKATRGNQPNRTSYLLLEGGCSCSIRGGGHTKIESAPQYFIDGIRQLLKQVPSVSVLIHTCQGDWRTEEVYAKSKRNVSLESFATAYPDLEEDVRYAIT